jgi:hypothetical protein
MKAETVEGEIASAISAAIGIRLDVMVVLRCCDQT